MTNLLFFLPLPTCAASSRKHCFSTLLPFGLETSNDPGARCATERGFVASSAPGARWSARALTARRGPKARHGRARLRGSRGPDGAGADRWRRRRRSARQLGWTGLPAPQGAVSRAPKRTAIENACTAERAAAACVARRGGQRTEGKTTQNRESNLDALLPAVTCGGHQRHAGAVSRPCSELFSRFKVPRAVHRPRRSALARTAERAVLLLERAEGERVGPEEVDGHL